MAPYIISPCVITNFWDEISYEYEIKILMKPENYFDKKIDQKYLTPKN